METVIRIALIYLAIVVGLRVLGKREFGELSPLELVSLLHIPEIVSQALVGEDFSLTSALIGLATLFSLVFLTSLLATRSTRIQDVLESSPTVLAYDGRLLEERMMKERVTPGEIFAEMRRVGLEQLSQVRWAVLETDGKISIVPAEGSGAQPADPEVAAKG